MTTINLFMDDDRRAYAEDIGLPRDDMSNDEVALFLHLRDAEYLLEKRARRNRGETIHIWF